MPFIDPKGFCKKSAGKCACNCRLKTSHLGGDQHSVPAQPGSAPPSATVSTEPLPTPEPEEPSEIMRGVHHDPR